LKFALQKELKNKIELEPDSIFLINDILSKIINFLGQKDGIKERNLKKYKMTIAI
jgi:hypothetical protein